MVRTSMLPNLLKKGMEQPDRVALFYYDEVYTYQQLDDKAGRLANGFKSHFQLKKGDVVAIQSSNSIAYCLTLLACLRAGISLTPLNPALKPDEISYQLANADAKVFMYEGTVAEKARLAAKKLPQDPHRVIFSGDKEAGEYILDDIFHHRSHSTEAIPLNTTGLIIYTSGTTGKPKGVLLSHGNIQSMIEMQINALQLTEKDRAFLILPLFHVNAITFTFLCPLKAGGSTVIRKKFVLEEFLPSVERYKPTYTSGVPTVYKMLADLPEGIEKKYDTRSMRFGICGAAPVSTRLFHSFESRYSFKLIEGWGLSEGTTASTLNPLDGMRKVGSIGIAMPGQEVRVVDEHGDEVPRGTKGELAVKGPNVMSGYLKRESETQQTLKNGWLYTGDIGYEDDDGYFYIVDRKKDVIIRGGMNVYPKQIEDVLYEMPDIIEAAVIGVPDDTYGEEVQAYVVLKEGAALTENELIAHCRKKMANYRCPKRIVQLDALPKNSVGKIMKNELRKIAAK